MKAKSYATLKRKLDKIFSEWIRRSNPSTCVSCGESKTWKELQCGHFVSRVRLATRWDEDNCHPQCARCNIFLNGNAVGYARYLENKYGSKIFRELDERSRTPTKFSRLDLQSKIDYYESKLKEII